MYVSNSPGLSTRSGNSRQDSLDQLIFMRYHTSCSNNGISGLCHDMVGGVFGERDNDALLLCYGCGGAGEENKGEEESLSEFHCSGIVLSSFVLLKGVVSRVECRQSEDICKMYCSSYTTLVQAAGMYLRTSEPPSFATGECEDLAATLHGNTTITQLDL